MSTSGGRSAGESPGDAGDRQDGPGDLRGGKAGRARRRLSPRGPWILAAGVLALHLAVFAATPSPPAFQKYPAAASAAVRGELPAERLVDFSPLYLELAKALHRIEPTRVHGALVALQLVLGAVAAGLLAAWLRRRLPAIAVVAAVAAFALQGRLLVLERTVEPEVLLLTLVLAWLAAADRRPGLAGLAAALAIATRPSLLPLAILGPIADRCRRGAWSRRRTVAFLAPVLVVLGLLALRNERAVGSFRAPTMNPGTVFFEGNNPLSRGTSAVYPPSVLELTDASGGTPDSPHVLYRRVARDDLGPPPARRRPMRGGLARPWTSWSRSRRPPPASCGRSSSARSTASPGTTSPRPGSWSSGSRSRPSPSPC